jgi:hypothetical protein
MTPYSLLKNHNRANFNKFGLGFVKNKLQHNSDLICLFLIRKLRIKFKLLKKLLHTYAVAFFAAQKPNHFLI